MGAPAAAAGQVVASPAAAPAAAPTAAAPATTTPQLLDNAGGPALLQRLDTLIFDCDGVLWRGNDVIPFAVDALHVMRASCKRLLFCTNNSSKSRQQYVSKFASLGINVAAEEVCETAAGTVGSAGGVRVAHTRSHLPAPPAAVLRLCRAPSLQLRTCRASALAAVASVRCCWAAAAWATSWLQQA